LGSSGRPSITKRQKERARQERNQKKVERRAQRLVERSEQPPPTPGVDPDIAWIVPGPQPRRDDE
jgi:hypothetical protein